MHVEKKYNNLKSIFNEKKNTERNPIACYVFLYI